MRYLFQWSSIESCSTNELIVVSYTFHCIDSFDKSCYISSALFNYVLMYYCYYVHVFLSNIIQVKHYNLLQIVTFYVFTSDQCTYLLDLSTFNLKEPTVVLK